MNYIAEMDWCAKHGVSQSWEQFRELPAYVRDDALRCLLAEQRHQPDSHQPTQDLLAQER